MRLLTKILLSSEVNSISEQIEGRSRGMREVNNLTVHCKAKIDGLTNSFFHRITPRDFFGVTD
jgi:hypothetical protein